MNAIFKPQLLEGQIVLENNHGTFQCPAQYVQTAKLALAKGIMVRFQAGWDAINSVSLYRGNTRSTEITEKEMSRLISLGLDQITTTNNKSKKTMAEKTQIFDFASVKNPTDLIINELTWKFLVRSVIRGKNIILLGPSGCGKTMSIMALKEALGDRSFYYFNMGSTQDPRAALIGNTHYNQENGTFFDESTFVRAIKTPNAIIMLDEMTRAHPEAGNILMTVLDSGQRYLRLDEAVNSPVVKVADGVCFIATANVGAEFTGTRNMDRALKDRFTAIIEVDPLTEAEEISLLTKKFPTVDKRDIEIVAKIAAYTRDTVKSGSGKLSTLFSTRNTVEATALLADGFSLQEVADVIILPLYDDMGGTDSERTHMRMFIQKFIDTKDTAKTKPVEDDTIDEDTLPF